MTDDLRQRYAEAISSLLDQPNGNAYRGTLPERLMTVRDEEVERLRARIAADERTLDRVIALAWNMRDWCSPDGVAVDYADKLAEALIGTDQPMKRGEAFFVLEAIGKGRGA
ncbi:hypothetical protein DMB42_11645 [Nonomuraea sp. WAC 01424]|uniref:hypothetical protein n=1 Tax=Nonomuraea sp. WAC 01424 TaxID=2203200 RepID=UPI000F76ADF5|nr:hypothetical protein [Nonomuraea sp. WAC 01424]RSN12824.1 hypothetical protein DMB42_11645 [Nonomuraea sp. WAC 01424]